MVSRLNVSGQNSTARGVCDWGASLPCGRQEGEAEKGLGLSNNLQSHTPWPTASSEATLPEIPTSFYSRATIWGSNIQCMIFWGPFSHASHTESMPKQPRMFSPWWGRHHSHTTVHGNKLRMVGRGRTRTWGRKPQEFKMRANLV